MGGERGGQETLAQVSCPFLFPLLFFIYLSACSSGSWLSAVRSVIPFQARARKAFGVSGSLCPGDAQSACLL